MKLRKKDYPRKTKHKIREKISIKSPGKFMFSSPKGWMESILKRGASDLKQEVY